MSFLSVIETSIANALVTAQVGVAAVVADTFRPAFIAGYTIWVVLIGYEVAWGKTEDGLTYVFTKLFKMLMIGTLALWGWPALAQMMDGLREAFIGILGSTTSSSASISAILEFNIIDPLLAMWVHFLRSLLLGFSSQNFWSAPIDLLQFMFGVLCSFLVLGVLALMAGLLCIISFAMYIVAFSVFQILLIVGPFFLMCLIYPFTQKFFETWVGAVMTSVLGMAFVALLAYLSSVALGLTTMNLATSAVILDDGGLVQDALAKVGTAGVLIYLYFKIFDLASALGGGMNMGNNMTGFARSLVRDLGRDGANKPGAGANSVNHGGSGGGSGSSGAARSANNRTLTGSAISAVGGAGQRAVMATASGAAGVARYAYNRVRN